MEFIELPFFSKLVLRFLASEEFRELQNDLINNPQKGAIIPGTHGARKIRVGYRAIGKRGGLRVIYY